MSKCKDELGNIYDDDAQFRQFIINKRLNQAADTCAEAIANLRRFERLLEAHCQANDATPENFEPVFMLECLGINKWSFEFDVLDPEFFEGWSERFARLAEVLRANS